MQESDQPQIRNSRRPWAVVADAAPTDCRSHRGRNYFSRRKIVWEPVSWVNQFAFAMASLTLIRKRVL